MKLKVSQPIADLNGEVINDGATNTPARLGDMCIGALTNDAQSDQNEPGNKKFHRWTLAKRINTALKEGVDEIEVPVEDLDLIKKRVAAIYPTKFVGPTYDAIEG